ncbi:hypothetical protein [Serratia marcescens]|uniref:hypothetical protein n=1 Tax=Serratia marcescens TaxID=615 RepID=UPI0029DCE13D|nr:hypothetical protein [Serratia marcescens]MDX7542803.1 hypothetical protein [Serratia marcescens]
MTLTTEQLKTRIEALRNSASGIASTFSGDADALEELLRYREAQPLYQYRMRNPYNRQVTDWETIKPEQVDFILKETIAANVEFRIIAAPPAPEVPDGFKLVPTVPTPEMIAAAMNCDDVTFINLEDFCVNFGNIYAAMLAAAPEGRSND